MSENCTACAGTGKATPKKYTITQSAYLTALAKLGRIGSPATREDIRLTNVEYSNFRKLTYWELIEEVQPGKWALTQLGKDFIEGRVRVPRHAYALAGNVVRFDGELVANPRARLRLVA
ncbi:hypothetical protein [Micromonospora sp. GCM10011541]|uniref:hypothetical protein n=1 Tax=Micromonospora sp. GCM10011541 TaxID=3317336 RepID=UPI003613447E